MNTLHKQYHFLIFHRVRIIPLKTIFLIGMITKSELQIEEKLVQVETVFGPGLYTSGTVSSVIGSYQQCFPFPICFPRQNVEVTDIRFRIHKYIGDGSLLF